MMTIAQLIEKIEEIKILVQDIEDQCLECRTIDHPNRRVIGNIEAIIDNILVDWKIEKRLENG